MWLNLIIIDVQIDTKNKIRNYPLLYLRWRHLLPQGAKMATSFRKPKRNIRQRLVKFESDDENNEDMDTEDTLPHIDIKPVPQKKKEKKKKEKSKSVLSFDHDEGEFFVK